LQKKKVLFIDGGNRIFTFCRSLLDTTCTVTGAGLGEEGFAAAVEQSPDLILIDLEHSKEKGFALCRRLTLEEATSHIPVMILYSSDHEATVRRASSLGVVDYISKPIIPTLFLKRIQTALERFSGRVLRCPHCYRPMFYGWSFCPFDGNRLPAGRKD